MRRRRRTTKLPAYESSSPTRFATFDHAMLANSPISRRRPGAIPVQQPSLCCSARLERAFTNRRIGGLPTRSIATFANTAQLRNKVARQCRRDDESAGETKKPTRTQRPSGAVCAGSNPVGARIVGGTHTGPRLSLSNLALPSSEHVHRAGLRHFCQCGCLQIKSRVAAVANVGVRPRRDRRTSDTAGPTASSPPDPQVVVPPPLLIAG
jgi:hypothetical protein